MKHIHCTVSVICHFLPWCVSCGVSVVCYSLECILLFPILSIFITANFCWSFSSLWPFLWTYAQGPKAGSPSHQVIFVYFLLYIGSLWGSSSQTLLNLFWSSPQMQSYQASDTVREHLVVIIQTVWQCCCVRDHHTASFHQAHKGLWHNREIIMG